MMQCYVTHDATTYGIRRGYLDYETVHPLGAWIAIGDEANPPEWFPDRSWFKHLKPAINNAEKQRIKKIKELGNQIKRIRRMEFK